MFRVRNFNMLLYILRYNHVYNTSVGFCIRYKVQAHVYMYEIHGVINMWHDSFNFKKGVLKLNFTTEHFNKLKSNPFRKS